MISHADRLDMLVGFFYFSGVKILADALRSRPELKMRVLVGMDAEILVGRLVETVSEGSDSQDAGREGRCHSRRRQGDSEADTETQDGKATVFGKAD